MPRKKKKPNLEFAGRLRSGMISAGFKNEDGHADVSRFSHDFRWTASYIYEYFKGVEPDARNLLKLSAELNISPYWLLGVEEFLQAKRISVGKRVAGISG